MVGVWLAGGVYVPVNPRLPVAERERLLADDPTRRLQSPNAAWSKRAAAPNRYDRRRRVRDVDVGHHRDDRSRSEHTHTAYVELLDRVLGPLRAGGDPAKRPPPNLIPVSMALNAGLYNVLFGLRAGAALVIMDRFEPESFAELVRRFEIRSTVLPPAAMAMLTDSAVTDLAPLKYVRSITAPLSPLQAQRFTAKFPVYVLNGYGQAEIGEVIGWTAADAKAHPEKVGAIGQPHPGVDVRIDDRRPPARAPAEHRVRARRSHRRRGLRRHRRPRPHRRRRLRLDRRSGGRPHQPRRQQGVPRRGRRGAALVERSRRRRVVVGAPDERLGEVPVAFLVGRPVPDAEPEALCREHLVAYKVPVAFHWIDELPRSEVGKVLRNRLIPLLPS